jgi:hypothetical protein
MEPIHVVGAVFIAYIVIKEVFVMVKGETKQIAKDMAALRHALLTKGEDNKTPIEQMSDMYTVVRKCCDEMERMVDYMEDLHKWHDKEDDDGVKIWYVRRSLEEGIKKLPVTLEKQRQLMSSLVSVFDTIQSDLKYIKDNVGSTNNDKLE